MNLKGVLVDFGYTLAYLNEENVRRHRGGLVSLLTRYGFKVTLDDLNSVLDSIYRNSTKGEVKTVYELWKVILMNLGIPENSILIKELIEFRDQFVATRWKLYDKASLVLSTLKKRYKLALVSNCFVGLSDVLRALNLTDFFDEIILSYEVGVTKPDRRIYLKTLERLRLKPEECVFVSDTISDLEGAREVGLKTILINQGEHSDYEAKDSSFKPDYQCKQISEIIEYL